MKNITTSLLVTFWLLLFPIFSNAQNSTTDSLALIALYNATDGINWSNQWNFNQPIDTWHGVTLDANGRVKDLHLGGNGLKGSLPSEIGDLTAMTRLVLDANELEGIIPPEIGNLNSLTMLTLSNNKFNSNIPPEIGNLSNLRFLFLQNSQFNGNIPVELSNINNLLYVWLENNQLTGGIPDEFSSMNLIHLHLNDNQLSGNIPNLSHVVEFFITNNKFSHEDVYANYSSNSTGHAFYYSPQYHGEVQSYIVEPDTTLTLGLSTPLPGNNNQNVSYQWKKNDIELVGSTAANLTIPNFQISDVGKYTLHMTDATRIADLEVISEPIYVIVSGYDLLGEPVEYKELIIEFDDWEDKTNYENTQLLPNAAVLVDSCSCNRLLYLWEFPNDDIAFQILLDIDSKKQTQSSGFEVDGGFNNILGVGPVPGTQGWTWTSDYPHNYLDSVTVFLLDSGADTQNWNAAPYLVNAAPLDDCYDISTHSGYDYADTLTSINSSFTDAIGHGTFGMRAIAEGTDAYMDMNVVPLKVFDKNGQGTLFNFVCALYHAIDHDADIINVSAGYSGQPSSILEDAIALAHSKGQFIVTATGNEGVNIDSFPQYPASYAKPFYKTAYDGSDSLVHYDNVISVATINVVDSLWQYSNYGNEAATIAAYGENMGGYSHTGDEVTYSGTSLSTYYVTRQLAAEIARDKTRNLEDVWADFEGAYLRDCSATNGLTSTGKCLDIQLKEVYSDLRVFLQGSFDAEGDTMRTDLNTIHHMLPGQIDSLLDRTMAIQPYDISPFDYYGTEQIPQTFQNYPPQVVDWVLVSARTEIEASTTLSRTAAWLLNDGHIQLLQPLFEELINAPDSAYIVIEHRNHLGIMSPQKLPINRNVVTWDFTTQDSYKSTGEGQIMLNNLYWGMLAGDTNNDLTGYDINGADKGFWEDDNGTFGFYLPTDFNLDGDVNGQDKIVWKNNNGKFSSLQRY